MFDFLKKIKKKATDILGVVPTAQKTARRALEIVPRAVRRADILPKPQTFTQRLSELSLPQTRKPTRITLTMPSVAWNMPNVVPMYQKQIKRVPAPVKRASKAYNVTQSVVPKVARLGTNIMNLQRERNRNDFKENIAALKSGNLAQHTAKKYEQTKFFRPTGKVRVRDLIREFPVGVQETAKDIARPSVRIALSAIEAPRTLRTGRASTRWYNTPLGRINSLQSEAQNRVYRGDSPLKTIANTTLDLFLGAGDVAGLAKPIARTAKTLPLVPKEVRNIAHDLTQTLRPTMDWRSGLMRGLSQPGMTIKRYHTPAGAKKDALAQHIVRKQIANQAAGRNRAEKGFVSPQNIPLIPQKQINKYYKNAYKVAMNQKNEAVVGRYPQSLIRQKKLPRDIYLRGDAYQRILEKHGDPKNVQFNKKLGFVKTVNEPLLYKTTDGKQYRVNLIRGTDNPDKKTINVVGTKPIPQDNRGYINTSFLANKTRDVGRILSEGRPVPSSPGGVSSLPHLDKIHQTPLSNVNNSTYTQKNQAEIIDPDELKKKAYLAGDTTAYDPKRHWQFTEMSDKQFANALKKNPNRIVKFTAGGSGSGKSEILLNNIAHDFDGIVLEGIMSNYDNAVSKLRQVKEAGKIPIISAILPRINNAWKFAQKRAIETGREVPLDAFVQKHIGFIDTLKKLVRDGYDVRLKDVRNSHSIGEAVSAPFITDPDNILDILDKIRYNEGDLITKLRYVQLSDKTRRKALARREAQRRAQNLSGRYGKSQPSDGEFDGGGISSASSVVHRFGAVPGSGRQQSINLPLFDKDTPLHGDGGFSSAEIQKTRLAAPLHLQERRTRPIGEYIANKRVFPAPEPLISPKQFKLQQQQRRLVIPKILRAMGYTKRELERKGADEIERLTKLQKLGYRKDDVESMNFDLMDRIIHVGATKPDRVAYHKAKHALDTHYLSGISSSELRDIGALDVGVISGGVFLGFFRLWHA